MTNLRACLFCGAEFEPRDSRHKFCCRSCGQSFRMEEVKKQEPVKLCVICNSIIKARGIHRRTCGSRKCINELRKRYKASINSALSAEISVQEVRQYYGLKPIPEGDIECLKCGKVFRSVDIRRNRLCGFCRETIQRYDVNEYCDEGRRVC